MMNTAEEYINERYTPLEKDLLEKTARRLGQNFSSRKTAVLNRWQKIIAAAVKEQEKIQVPCGYISLSLLNTSIMAKNPRWQMDFYNSQWVYGESWYRECFKADFLFEDWEDFCRQALDDGFYIRRIITSSSIRSLFWETADKLAYLAACYAKYYAADLGDVPEIKSLVKEDAMYVTCGVYLDWQERIYGILPQLDLTDVPDNTETTFREFKGEIYEAEAFIDLDLSHCRFIGCKFIGSIFNRIALKDAYFDSCAFTDVNFVETKISGCVWSRCRFQNCLWQNSGTASEGDEYFAEGEIKDSVIVGMQIINSEFSHFMLTRCQVKDLKLIGSRADHSSLMAYMEAG